MIRRSPSEYYLKYLLVHPDDYGNSYIRDVAIEHGLDFLGDWYLDRLRVMLDPPFPFFPENRSHVPSRRFIRDEKIEQVFLDKDDMPTALKILERPRLREVVEVMMLSQAPMKAIVYGLKVRHKFECTELALKLYRHYFWNLDLVDTTETRAIVHRRFENVVNDQRSEIRGQYGVLHRLRSADPRVAASRLPSSPLTALMAQVQMGVAPGKISLAEVLESGRLMASLRALEAAATGGPVGAAMVLQYATGAKMLAELLDAAVKPEDQLRDELQAFRLKSSQEQVPLLTNLTKGHHTVDLQPEPEPEQEFDDAEDGDGAAEEPAAG